jgi:hypothetical protein
MAGPLTGASQVFHRGAFGPSNERSNGRKIPPVIGGGALRYVALR